MAQSDLSQKQKDEALLQRFGYRQELRRTLGFLSNFAVAFSYISVSTGTFSLTTRFIAFAHTFSLFRIVNL